MQTFIFICEKDNKEKYFVVQGQDIEDAKKTFLQENYKIDKVKKIKPYHLGIKQKGEKMSRIRLNQEYRNKIANRMRVHLEQEPTQEKEKYDELKADQIELNNNAWNLAETIVRKHYTPEDVKMAYHLQNKFENVSTIAKDSCFHFHYLGN